jgi:formylglycine-generating enzyme required for sulfatase activity
VLKALLPESGKDIRGQMRSIEELLVESGYSGRRKEFHDLVRILDSEIRLITPTDPKGSETADDSKAKVEVGHKFYQLTHDYLVHSLREWLTRKQKETRRGRAELRLAERAALWNAKPENRLLPSLWEYLNIRLHTDKAKWTSSQGKAMAKAGRYHGIRASLVGIAIVAVTAVGFAVNARVQERENRNYANALVQSLLAANTADLADLVGEIAKYHQWATPLLRKVVEGKESTRKQKLHASLTLLKDDPLQADYVLEQLLGAQVEEVTVIITLLRPYKGRVKQRLWETVKSGTIGERRRAAAALAAYDSENTDWQKVRSDVVTSLVSVAPVESKQWTEMLRPVRTQLVEPIQARYRDRSPQRDSERQLAAAALADYLNDQPKKLTELILLADNDREFLPFLEALRSHRSACVDDFRSFLSQSPPSNAEPGIPDRFWKKQANAAVCLLGLGERETVWPLLKNSENPSLRSFIIDRLARLGADYNSLSDRLGQESDPSTRQALILALGEFDAGKLSERERQGLVEKLSALYRHDPDPGVHSAAGWTLRQCQSEKTVPRLDAELQMASTKSGGTNGRWFINSEGQTFVVVNGPADFLMGDEKNTGQGRPNKVTIARRFAIAAHEVTVTQFKKFTGGYARNRVFTPEADCPANSVTWFGAAAYCNWLSQQEGIPKEQQCYEKNEKGEYGPGMKIPADCLRRTGYRLPTEAEWEYVCRANTRTSFSFGEPEELLPRYTWYVDNSRSRTWPVGRLRPNALGVFDMHGNLWEWCQDRWEQTGERSSGASETVEQNSARALRGGAFSVHPSNLRSASRTDVQPDDRNSSIGFRPARTYP